MSKRAQRRHHNQRMKQRAMRIVRDTHDYRGTTRARLTAYFVKNADNLKTCGKTCCGNPRRSSEGATYAERIGDREIADGLNDYSPVVQRQRRLGDNEESAGSTPGGTTGTTALRCFGGMRPW
jgi:hypothetical protein